MAGTKSSGRPSVKHQLEVKGDQGVPEMPEGLGPHALEMWNLAIESLPHVIRRVDGPILRLACESYEKAVVLFAAGETKEAASMAKTFEALASKIGLHPSSRRVVRPVDDEESKDGNDFDKWLAKGRGKLN